MATTPTTPEPRDLGDIAISLDCTVTDLEAFRELIDFIFYRDGSADDELASPLAALRNALRAIVADFGGIQAELSDYRRRTKEGGCSMTPREAKLDDASCDLACSIEDIRDGTAAIELIADKMNEGCCEHAALQFVYRSINIEPGHMKQQLDGLAKVLGLLDARG